MSLSRGTGSGNILLHSPPMASSTALPPHPTLDAYYESPATKRSFLRELFDTTAGDYDKTESLVAMGSGKWYRRDALKRSGLKPGMRVLDVAIGTGLVAREEIGIVGDAKLVTGLDPSIGMISHAVRQLGVKAVLGVGEALPLADGQFDFVSMGYALRHVADIRQAFAEYYRVLKPGGRVCILEISRPGGPIHRLVLKTYMKVLVPMVTRLQTRHADTQKLWEYYWETIEQCVAPEQVTDALRDVGFQDVKWTPVMKMFSEYTGTKPE
jgi:demethylmenaquinone methyltransferase/2-methoxy-6-polyprenyl-1,4-benzoquinol methylase